MPESKPIGRSNRVSPCYPCYWTHWAPVRASPKEKDAARLAIVALMMTAAQLVVVIIVGLPSWIPGVQFSQLCVFRCCEDWNQARTPALSEMRRVAAKASRSRQRGQDIGAIH